jgi:hypothetical protein
MSKAYYGITPCKGCDKRVVGCHGNCKEYQAWTKNAVEVREPFMEFNTKRKRRLRRR